MTPERWPIGRPRRGRASRRLPRALHHRRSTFRLRRTFRPAQRRTRRALKACGSVCCLWLAWLLRKHPSLFARRGQLPNMAYPLSAPVIQVRFDQVQNELKNVRTSALAVQTGTAGGAAVFGYTVINLADSCRVYRADFSDITSNTALQTQLVAYVQAQIAGGSTLGPADYANLNTLCGNVLTAFGTDYPHNGPGILQDRTYSGTSGQVWVTLTAAQLPNVLTAVTALLTAMT